MKPYSRDKALLKIARPHRSIKSGFSLVELLVVLAILIILATLAAPSLTSIFSGTALSQAGQTLQDQLNLFRQLAVNNNYIVEVRIYNFVDSSLPNDANSAHAWDTPGHYRGIQAFKVTPLIPLQSVSVSPGPSPQIVYTKTAITKPLRLPASVIIDGGYTLSNASNNPSYLIKYLGSNPGFYANNLGPTPQVAPQVPITSPAQPVAADPPIFNVGYNYTYVSFQYQPDGSTNLTYLNSPWGCFMTLHARANGDSLQLSNLPKNYFVIQIDPTNGHANAYRP